MSKTPLHQSKSFFNPRESGLNRLILGIETIESVEHSVEQGVDVIESLVHSLDERRHFFAHDQSQGLKQFARFHPQILPRNDLVLSFSAPANRRCLWVNAWRVKRLPSL